MQAGASNGASLRLVSLYFIVNSKKDSIVNIM
jgi:hypothetical protein